MAKIVVEGDHVSEIIHALGRSSTGDIIIHFRRKYGRDMLSGLKIISADKCKNREFTTLEESIQWIRQLYREEHEIARVNRRTPTAK